MGQAGRSAIDGSNQWPSAELLPGFRPAVEASAVECSVNGEPSSAAVLWPGGDGPCS